MGGKSSQSTQQIQIPPEVLARYNAVNARAEVAAATPFQQYSTDPSAFVAPLTPTQQAGIANTNYYSGTAQPYYAAATQQLGQAQNTALPFYGQAAQQTAQAQDVGQRLAGLSYESLYGGQQAATPLQQEAAGAYGRAYSGAQPFQAAATGLTLGGAQAVNPEYLGGQQINQFMSPYLANVLQGTAALQNQMNQQAMSGQTGNAIRQGAFGGDRAGIAAATLAQQQQLASNKTFSDILNQGYGQALATAQQQQQLGLGAAQANRAALQAAGQQLAGIGQQGFQQGLGYGQAQSALGQQLFGQGATSAQQLANLGQQQFGQGLSAAQQNAALGAGLYGMGSQTAQQLAALGVGAQGAGLQGAQAQIAAGQAQQQTEQAGKQALYNQFLQQQSYPFQVAQFLANIAEGTGALSGSTTQTSQMLSDKRLKENIKPIGKTFDGQNIYSYNFKGSPQTEIGLLAQEVEKHHPEAVGLAGGYRTVNYNKATDDAAERGHFASGGAASMGGGVMPYHGGEGFYDGGSVGYDPSVMQQILAAYQNMYAPMQGQKGGLGAASYVPEATGPVGQLMTAGALPDTPNPMANVKGMVDIGTGVGQLGGNLNLWDYTDEQRAETERKKKEKRAGNAYGGLAGGRHGYEDGGITVVGKKQEPEEPEKVEVPSATPAPAQMAPVAKVDTSKTYEKPSFQKVGLDIPQIGNTVGLTPAAALTPLKDSTGDILSGIGKIGSAAAALGLSDRRLKENIKPVGKTFDGQTVYSYNYKGEHQTRMGLIAQEVAKHHPEAVHKVGGYGAVDYKKATNSAAHRGHFAIGGEADDDTGAPGMNIPLQGNQVGLAGAAGLEPLKDSTGDILKGLGSIGEAGAKIFKKAEGGEIDSIDNNPIMQRLIRQLNPMLTEEEERLGTAEHLPEPTGLAPRKEEAIEFVRKPVGLAPASDFGYRQERSAPVVSSGKVDPEIVSFFMDKGLSQGQALGIAAGIHAESGGNPSALNKESGAMGLGQWLGSRKAGIIKQFGPNPSKGEQLEYLWGELKGGDRGGPAVLAHEDPKDVLHAYITRFMRPAAGYETESDLRRGHAAMGYASGGLAGRHGYATDGEVDGPENILPAQYNAVSPDEAAQIGDRATKSGVIGAEDMARMIRTAPTPEAKASVYKLMADKNIGVSGSGAPGLAGGEAAPQAPAAPTAKAPTKSRGFLGDIARGSFISGLGKGEATSWIPLLTGIGASMSGPYRGIVGLGQGLAAGAQAAQAQREYGLKGRQVSAVEMEAMSDRIRANSDLLRAEMTNVEQLNGAIQNTSMMIAMARQGGADTRELNAQMVALTNRRNQLVTQGGAGTGSGTSTSPVITQSPYAGLPKYNPTDPNSVLTQADIEQLGGGVLPSTQARTSLLGQGMTLDTSGKPGTISGFGAAKGNVAATSNIPQEQVTVNRNYADRIRTDFEQYQDTAPIVAAIPRVIAQQPTPSMIKDVMTKVAGIFKMTPQQVTDAFGTTYDAAALAQLGNAIGIPIDPSDPVRAVNVLLEGVHKRFDNLDKKYQAVEDIANYAQSKGISAYDPSMDYPILVSRRVYGNKGQ